MYRKKWLLALTAGAVILACSYVLAHANISALPQPGRLETAVAGRIRNRLISNAARGVSDPPVTDGAASVSQGKDLYEMDCASCHGEDGRHPTPVGKSLYPRAADLGSAGVQKMSDREIFWVIKNGIRLSGMPGFGRIDTDGEIWQLTFYLRTLGKLAKQ